MPKVISSEKTGREYRRRSVPGVPLFIGENVVSRIANHADIGFAEEKEIMGLVMGRVYRDEEGEYSVACDTATAKLDSTGMSVRFDPDSLEDLFESIDGSAGDGVIGWYHSHPGFGCYLSDVDIRTHSRIFGEGLGFAIVIDPSDESLMVFTVEKSIPKTVQIVIAEDE
ncbi:MAG: Mov34/MPN/PAD-1 family protein [Candidatus Methanomethylophilaceae archaeon]|nr:proteasome regulatory subunit [Candidatus Methanomethylophilaceae archaeon]